MHTKDGRTLARANEHKILRALHRFGWLRTRDIAVLAWTKWGSLRRGQEPVIAPVEPDQSALRSAQRTLARMRRRSLILTAEAPNGSAIHALGEGGARALQQQGIGATSGKDGIRRYSAAHFTHRCISNQIAVAGILQGYRVATEREISQHRWPLGDIVDLGKNPDVFFRGLENKIYFIEVERSRKNQGDYTNLLDWLVQTWANHPRPGAAASIAKELQLVKVIFVCRPAFETRLKADMLTRGWTTEQLATRLAFDTLLYKLQDIAFF